jgi:signal transduction histidine kinase
LTSDNPDAPPIPEETAAKLRAGQHAVASGSITSDDGLILFVRMPWFEESGSPCAFVYARQRGGRAPSLTREFLLGAVAVSLLMAIAMLFAAGPLVRRVRRLTAEVRRTADERYTQPIALEGRDELATLAEAFNTAGRELRAHAAALEQRERSLREFVEGTTHDLMLPLTVLQGHLVSLREGAEGSEAELLAEALEEAHYMGSLVGNLSTAAKLEAADSHLRQDPVDLVGVIERVVTRNLTVAREKAVSLESVLPGAPMIVRGDGTLIEQAVGNLLHNAVRYVEARGRVLIVLSSHGNRFSLRVQDDGAGMAPEQLERLTERRWRADAARSRHPDGSGLGLAIANEVCLRHGFVLSLRKAEELGGLEAEIAGPM